MAVRKFHATARRAFFLIKIEALLMAMCLVWLAMPCVAVEELDAADAVLMLDFSSEPAAEKIGSVERSKDGPQPPIYPNFEPDNVALRLQRGSFLRIADGHSPEQSNSDFDFDIGDAITIEAWVKPDSLTDNAYIIGKGRSERGGPLSQNQNWAMRLRNQNGLACLNFLFRSRGAKQDGKRAAGDWHRWTSKAGFAIDDRWHHVAVTYQFGDGDSLRGFIDGKRVTGKWDMGGKTNAAPVVDDDAVWIGSAMAGHPTNSFQGMIDDLAVYRSALPDSELMERYQVIAREVQQPDLPSDAIVMELFGPHANYTAFPQEFARPALSWRQEAMGLTRIPNQYDSWGVIDDWTRPGLGTLMLRSWCTLNLEPGDYQFLVRSRGLSRLVIDGNQVLSTPAQVQRSGAHHVVDPLPGVPVAGMRPHYMNDHERVVDFHSAGGTHIVRFDFNVGGAKYPLRVGETCVAIARPGEMFRLLSKGTAYPLDDLGWEQFAARQERLLGELDQNNRRKAGLQIADYWSTRHDWARENLLRPQRVRMTLDAVLQNRLTAHNQLAATAQPASAAVTHFQEHVQPILSEHCYRCHADKKQGDLSLVERSSLLAGGESGVAAIVPGDPERSYLWELVSAPPDDYRMPPEGPGLDADELSQLKRWIQDGAVLAKPRTEAVTLPKLVDDATFLRRVFLDTVGVVPTRGEIDQFFSLPSGERRQAVVDELLRDARWADHWVGYWQDVLAENPNLLKPTLNNTGPFRYWIRDAFADNKPLDRFATELITMRGSRWYGGAAGFAVASQNDAPMAAKAHIVGNAFLGVEMKCARCHDAPYHDWKQQDLFELAAMLEGKSLTLPESSSVPDAFFSQQTRQSLISATLRPGAKVQAAWPLTEIQDAIDPSFVLHSGDSREQLAVYATSSRRFAAVMANRLWARLMGRGLVEPLHDWDDSAPSDPVLLDWLTDLLIESDYDARRFQREILLSDAYQRQATSEVLPVFAAPVRRRMSAEQIVDSALVAVGQRMDTEMLTLDLEGTFKADTFFNFGRPNRAWEFTTLGNERDRPSLALPRAQAIADVLQAFGWRDSRPEPISRREEAPNLVQPGALANGTLGGWLTRLADDSELTQLMLQEQSVDELVDALFWSILTRRPTQAERMEFTNLLQEGYATRKVPAEQWPKRDPLQRFRNVSWSNHLNTEANKIKIQMEELARRGPPPTRYLTADWRVRAEDAIWALLNNPEMILVP